MSSSSKQKQAKISTPEIKEEPRTTSPVSHSSEIEEFVKHESHLSLKKNISWLSDLPCGDFNAPALVPSHSLQKAGVSCITTVDQELNPSYSFSPVVADALLPPSLETHAQNESIVPKATKRARPQRKVKIEVEKDDGAESTISTPEKSKTQVRSRDDKFSVPEPENWKEIWELLEEMRVPGGVAGDAPVDSMGYVYCSNETML